MISTVTGSVTFTLDDANQQTISTNIPTTVMQPFFQVVSATNAAKTFDADYFSLFAWGLTR
jgi:hypothetical protein